MNAFFVIGSYKFQRAANVSFSKTDFEKNHNTFLDSNYLKFNLPSQLTTCRRRLDNIWVLLAIACSNSCMYVS